MFTVCHTEEAELLPPQLLPRCPVYDTILIWFLILFPMLSMASLYYYQFLRDFRTQKADQLGIVSYWTPPRHALNRLLSVVGNPCPGTITLDTPSATSAHLSLVRLIFNFFAFKSSRYWRPIDWLKRTERHRENMKREIALMLFTPAVRKKRNFWKERGTKREWESSLRCCSSPSSCCRAVDPALAVSGHSSLPHRLPRHHYPQHTISNECTS